MLDILVATAIGFSCVTPGIAVANLGGVGIQPVLVLFVIYFLVFPILRLRIPLQPMLWIFGNIMACIISFALAVPSSAGAAYAAFQGGYYAMAGLGFGTILSVPQHRRAFVNGYVCAALVSSVAGIVQASLSQFASLMVPLANNQNFSLVVPIGRAVAFTPEASVLAGLLLPAFLCVWFDRRCRNGALAAGLRSPLALVVLLAGLAATRSSMLLAAPAVLLATAAFLEHDWRAFFAASGRILAVAAVGGIVFMPLYAERIGDTDEAGWSRAWRQLKINAGLDIFKDHPAVGAGIGYVSDVNRFSKYFSVPHNIEWMRDSARGQPNPSKGIDSTPVRILAEGGALGLLLAYYPVIVFWRKARSLAHMPEWRPIFALCLPLLFAQTVALGYRDLIVLLLPAVAFAVAGNVTLGARSWREGRAISTTARIGGNPGAAPTTKPASEGAE